MLTGVAATVACVTLGSSLLAGVTGAGAAPPPGTTIIAATGSDTSDDLMEAYLFNPDPNGPGDNGRYNIRAKYDGTTTEFVPGDSFCADRTYGSSIPLPPGVTLAPNGSTAGRNALRDTLSIPGSTGCYDIARSSSTPRAVGPSGDRATFEYYAVGIDGLSWSAASLNAPHTLTRAQLQGIYNTCLYNDWSQVGGAPGKIQRLLPQAGSGTRAFFESDILGAAPPTGALPGVDGIMGTADDCPAIVDTQSDGSPLNEHVGAEVPIEHYQTGIFPYGSGQWIFQANLSINPTLDKRNGFRIGNFTGVSTFTASTTTGSATLSTATTNRFTNVNLDATVTGTGIPAGTKIVSISPDGTTATMSNTATATGSTSVTVTSLPAVGARWITVAPGGWLPNTPNLANPRAPVSETQIGINNPNRSVFGMRYIFNVVDTTSPSYAEARALVGFDNIPGGSKSPLCDGSQANVIRNAGFAPLSATTPSGVDPARNLANSTCRRYTP